MFLRSGVYYSEEAWPHPFRFQFVDFAVRCEQAVFHEVISVTARAEFSRAPSSLHRGQQVVQRHGGEARGVITHGVRDNQLAPV